MPIAHPVLILLSAPTPSTFLPAYACYFSFNCASLELRAGNWLILGRKPKIFNKRGKVDMKKDFSLELLFKNYEHLHKIKITLRQTGEE